MAIDTTTLLYGPYTAGSIIRGLIGTKYEIAMDGDLVKWRHGKDTWSVGCATREEALAEIEADRARCRASIEQERAEKARLKARFEAAVREG